MNAYAILGGSSAKDTWLSKSKDVDIFVQFSYQKYNDKSQEISKILEKVIKKEKEPFISIILTAGNHSPYTIPKINKFKRINFTNEHKKYGFVHEKELNAFRFMDFSLLPGTPGYILWKLGVISFWKRFILKRYRLQKKDIPVGGVMPENMNVQKVHEKEFLKKHQALS